MKSVKIISLVLLTAAVLFGCGTALDDTTGSIELNIDNGIGSRMIDPPISMQAFDYEVTVTGFTPSVTVVTENTLIDGLIPGTYAVSIIARNADGIGIGSGSAADIVVTVASSTTVNIAVNENTAVDGSLSGTIGWAPDILSDPSITGYLKSSDNVQTDLTFTLDIPNCTATTTADPLTVGYYTLINQVRDGGDVSAGFAEVVRIVSGYETTYNKVISVNQMFGGLDIIMELNMNDPLVLGFDVPAGDVTVYTEAMPFTLTSVDEAGYIAVWYVDGSVVATDADTYTIDPALYAVDSSHRLDCIVFSIDGSRANSESWNLDFTGLTEYDPTIIKFVSAETGAISLTFTPIVDGALIMDNREVTAGAVELSFADIVPGEYIIRVAAPPRDTFHYFDADTGMWSLDEPTNGVLFPNYLFPEFDFGSF